MQGRWSIDKLRMTSIATQLRDRLGFVLQERYVKQPDIELKVGTRGESKKAMILTRIELNQFQRRATLSVPGAIELHRGLVGALAGRKSEDGMWLYDDKQGEGACTVYELPDWEGGEPCLIYMRGDSVVGVHNPKGFVHQKPRKPPTASNFMPEQINWKRRLDGDKKVTAQTEAEAVFPTELKEIPLFDVTRVASRASTWIKRLPDIGMATKIILEGRLSLPMASADVPSCDDPNLPTCKEAPQVIDALVAEYLIGGILEYCQPGFEPHCISPLGLVPKKTSPFFRLIVDLRKPNLFHAEWKSHMSGLAANAMAFNPGAVAFSRDLKSAYLLSALAGCEPGLHSQPKRMKVPSERRMWVGCTPETCLGGCNKSYFGIRWRDQLYRYAAPCFGSRHGGCVLATLMAPVVRKLKALGCEIIEWVDDWLCVVKKNGGADHDPKRCGGEEECEHCKDCFRRAREIERLVDEELEHLGLLTSEKNEPLCDGCRGDTYRSVQW